jgi:REP element-mobilizing transposase RayT
MVTESKEGTAQNFEPVDPWMSEDLTFKRRNLPHLNVLGATYFVTFRSRILLTAEARDMVIAMIRDFSGKHIDLDAAVVMPDHVHLIFRLLLNDSLGRILHLIKGRSARQVNQLLNRDGPLWMDESFDHIIRNEAELEEKIEYIKQNPVKNGLATQPLDYKWLLLTEPKSRHTG